MERQGSFQAGNLEKVSVPNQALTGGAKAISSLSKAKQNFGSG
jgi:hypothetical protein